MSVTSDIGPWGIIPRKLLHEVSSSTAIAVYALLSTYADRRADDGWTASRKGLAGEIGVSPATFDRAVKVLVDSGWLEVIHRIDENGDQGWNRYIVFTVQMGVLENEETPPENRVAPSTEVMNVPRPLNQTPQSDPARAPVGEFDEFWAFWPKKTDKAAAVKAHKGARKKASAGEILDGLHPWMRYWDERGEPQFIPFAATWLNKERWRDEPPAANGTKRRVSPGVQAMINVKQREAMQQGELPS